MHREQQLKKTSEKTINKLMSMENVKILAKDKKEKEKKERKNR